jgi:hypothetical protein
MVSGCQVGDAGAGKASLIGEKNSFLRRHCAPNRGVLRGLVLPTLLQHEKLHPKGPISLAIPQAELRTPRGNLGWDRIDRKRLSYRFLRCVLRIVFFDDQSD